MRWPMPSTNWSRPAAVHL